jgi:hypothetical protein
MFKNIIFFILVLLSSVAKGMNNNPSDDEKGEISYDKDEIQYDTFSEGLAKKITQPHAKIEVSEMADEEIEKLAKALADNTSVTSLGMHLCNGHMTEKGVKALADMLKSNTTLTDFYFDNDKISPPAQYLLKYAFVINSTLTKIELDETLPKNFAMVLRYQVEKNKRIAQICPRKDIRKYAKKFSICCDDLGLGMRLYPDIRELIVCSSELPTEVIILLIKHIFGVAICTSSTKPAPSYVNDLLHAIINRPKHLKN